MIMSIITQSTNIIGNARSSIVQKEYHTSYDFSIFSLGDARSFILFKMYTRVIKSTHWKHIKKVKFLLHFLNVMRLTQRKIIISLSNLNP